MRVAVVMGLVLAIGCASGPWISYDKFTGVCAVAVSLDAGGPSVLRGAHGESAAVFWWVPGPITGESAFQCVSGDERIEFKSDDVNVKFLAHSAGVARTSERIAVGSVADVKRLAGKGWECRFYNHKGAFTPKDRATIATFVGLVTGPRPAACGSK